MVHWNLNFNFNQAHNKSVLMLKYHDLNHKFLFIIIVYILYIQLKHTIILTKSEALSQYVYSFSTSSQRFTYTRANEKPDSTKIKCILHTKMLYLKIHNYFKKLFHYKKLHTNEILSQTVSLSLSSVTFPYLLLIW